MSNGFSINQPNSNGARRFYPVACRLLALVFMGLSTAVDASDEDYLTAIEMETEKVGVGGAAPAATGSVKKPHISPKKEPEPDGRGLDAGLSIEKFEKELAERYTGSSVFYRKLSRPDQEAVYAQYKDGAPLAEVRQKIMDRFLKR
jgi:hypothetical protein